MLHFTVLIWSNAMTDTFENAYQGLILDILSHGEDRSDRTGVGTRSLFGANIQFDCSTAPVITKRQMYTAGVIGEYCAFMRGFTDNRDFRAFGCNYWTPWADGDRLGPIYGAQWRNFNQSNQVDQIDQLIKTARINPHSRQMVVSAWNPLQTEQMALPPCFHSFQVLINRNQLNIQVNQRSADVMIGLPSDAILHYLLMLTLCEEIGTTPGRINFAIGDAHIYNNHIDSVPDYITGKAGNPGTIRLINYRGLNHLTPDNFEHEGYVSHNKIKFEINV
jgi:thymidylate synthase